MRAAADVEAPRETCRIHFGTAAFTKTFLKIGIAF